MTENKKYYESFEYWFSSPDIHSDVNNYGKDYYGYKIYKNIILNYNIPSNGNIVVIGTNNCLSFDLLCNKYGRDRCVGFDLYNPSNHDRVLIKDCRTLSDDDNMPMAFCHNDVGNYPKTPGLKAHAQKWAAKNMVKGGVFLGRNNLNSAGDDNEGLMQELGFKNILFKDLLEDFPIIKDILDERTIEGHMLSVKI